MNAAHPPSSTGLGDRSPAPSGPGEPLVPGAAATQPPSSPRGAAEGRRRSHRREPVAASLRGVLFVVYGLPLAWIVVTSLRSPGDVISGTLLSAPTTDAYREALANPQLPTALLQSAQIAVGTTALVLALGVPLAYALAQVRGRVAAVVLGAMIFLQMVPQTSNVIPLYTIFNQVGLLDTTPALVLANAAMLLPWATTLLRPFFVAVPPALEEAAHLDGAGRLRTFWSVMLPVVRNGVATVGALVFLVSWGEFLYAINLFISPLNYPMSALIAQQTSGYGINWPGLMAFAVISSLPLLVVYAASFRLLREGLSVGAVK